MNAVEMDVLLYLSTHAFDSQRGLSVGLGLSLGLVNRSLQELRKAGYLNEKNQLTAQAQSLFGENRPKNAVILAAGYGMRMIPVSNIPKALLKIKGERLIERLIRQLHEAGISDVTVVAGFQKEQLEYLIDLYGIHLVCNEEYASKNNLSSLRLAADQLGNTYVLPCDIWCRENPFREYELYSWYMLTDRLTAESEVRINRKREIVRVAPQVEGNAMIGICYLTKEDGRRVRDRLREYGEHASFEQAFWEDVLYDGEKMSVYARLEDHKKVTEINTYEQLRELDADSEQLQSAALQTISGVLNCSVEEIQEIQVLKKGMTNNSFLFSVRGSRYIMRIPGQGTNLLINRKQEAEVFRAIRGRGLCDDPVYINPDDGFKITRYLEGVRVCDVGREEDLKRCMGKLRRFHKMNIQVSHGFDIYGQIDYYESLWKGQPSVFPDYNRTKEAVFSLRSFLDSQEKDRCLTHIDAVCDNFLFYKEAGEEKLQLTDWEYSGMQDPLVDIAMFCIYSYFDKKKADHLMDLYFNHPCDELVRARIYCYMAACGLLWSNWSEYKRQLGVEFGEYLIRQYRYAKEYTKFAKDIIKQAASEGAVNG